VENGPVPPAVLISGGAKFVSSRAEAPFLMGSLADGAYIRLIRLNQNRFLGFTLVTKSDLPKKEP